MRIAVFGRTAWLYDTVRACLARGHQVVLIGTCPAEPEYTVKEDDFDKLADELGCPFFCDPAINRPRYIQMARESKAQVAISINWLSLLGQEMLRLFPYGVINAHAGDLPRFRGNAAPNWAILMGEPKVVLTLHQMAVELDAGPILLQREFPLTSHTYVADVYKFIGANVPEMFVEVLEGFASGSVEARRQPDDPTRSLRCFPRRPSDGAIDWHRPAEELGRLVRASAEPFAGAFSFLNNERIIIWRAHVEPMPSPYLGVPGQVADIRPHAGEVAVITGEGLLVVEEIETLSGGRDQAAEMIKSMRTRFGVDLTQEIARLKERVARLEAELRPKQNQ